MRGGYNYIHADQIFCFVCKESIEDEVHFSFECPFYVKYRTSLYEVRSEPDTESFKTCQNIKC